MPRSGKNTVTLLTLSMSCAFAQAAAASSSAPYHSEMTTISGHSGCAVVAAPASGKKLQITLVRLNEDGSYNNQIAVVIYRDASCLHPVAAHTPQSTGQTVVPFNPPLDLPTNGPLMVKTWTGDVVEVFVDGYQITP